MKWVEMVESSLRSCLPYPLLSCEFDLCTSLKKSDLTHINVSVANIRNPFTWLTYYKSVYWFLHGDNTLTFNAETSPGYQQTSRMESFATLVDDCKPLVIVVKLSILIICGNPGCVSIMGQKMFGQTLIDIWSCSFHTVSKINYLVFYSSAPMTYS